VVSGHEPDGQRDNSGLLREVRSSFLFLAHHLTFAATDVQLINSTSVMRLSAL
jgi:hypothetical protein